MKPRRSCTQLLVCSVLLLLSGCHNDPQTSVSGSLSDLDKPELLSQLTYSYIGYSRAGEVIVRGQLVLSVRDWASFSGHWSLRAIADPNRIGPQVGNGRLTGQLRGSVLSINLNPNNVDNNVLLNGRFARDRFGGQWEWIGFPGVINSGTFEAILVRTPALEQPNAE